MLVKNVIQKIERKMQEEKSRIAVRYNEAQYTYEDLDYVTYCIAIFLQSKDISTEDIVAIYMERSWSSVCTTIGIMRSGAAFLPIDRKTPINRIKKILEISKAKMIICDTELEINREQKIDIVNIDYIITRAHNNEMLKSANITETTLAYVMFTSGTTGEPKGVMIEYGGLCNHISEKIRVMEIDNESVVAHNASIGFDISVWQILAPLCCGAEIVIFAEKTILQISRFIKILEREKVTILEVVPTYLNLIISEYKRSAIQTSLKFVISTGQELTKALVDRWFSILPEIPLVNAYGPTEASDDIAHCIITKSDEYEKIPIGVPINNVQFIVNRDQGFGEKGELWVRGICVGRGYIENEEETKKFFAIDENTKARIYKTGDLVSRSIDGNYFYHGRIDNQVKLHGNRIELEEIENCIMKYSDINETTVIFDKEREKLCAVFTAEKAIDIVQLKEHLAQRMPYYMIPSFFVQINEIPVDINGKVDLGKLMKLSRNEGNMYNEKIEDAVCDIIKDIMKLQELPENEAWKDDMTIIGFESLTCIQLIVSIEEAFGFEFDEKDLQPKVIFNFRKICNCIREQIK